MLLISSEMKTIFCAILLTGLTTARVRQHFLIADKKTWFEAQQHCRDNYNDLSTINSESEYEIFQADKSNSNDDWIGLRRAGVGWQWSDGSTGTFQMWKSGQPDNTDITKQCVKLKDDEWEQDDCTVKKEFYCYKWVPGVSLVMINMSWENALMYCRKYYTDLANLTTQRSLIDAKSRTTTSVWTGLRFLSGSWFWVTGEPLGSQVSLPSCPAEPFRCGARNSGTDGWENRNCEEKLNFLCIDHKVWNGSSPGGPQVIESGGLGGQSDSDFLHDFISFFRSIF